MKIEHAESNVLGSGGLGQTQSFQIKANAHAFKMLSSGLYSDKIGAVLREIGCNAHDAHISAGVSHKPFEVKMPNAIDNQFWIKDFGPGLSHYDIMGLYTSYFTSTKQNSNDFTGGFGLGSKSPFSYTDNFSITSCHDGKKMVFSAHIANDGAPKIAAMSSTPTTETGMTISFPVASTAFEEFRQKAQKIFQYFNPLPTILGGDDIVPIQYMLDKGDFAILEEAQRYRSNGQIWVQMGNVVYPVNKSQLGSSTFVKAFEHSDGFLFRTPMGTMNVAASREGVQYDATTIATLEGLMKKAVLHVAGELEQMYSTMKTWKDRCSFSSLAGKAEHGMSLSDVVLTAAGIKDAKVLAEAIAAGSVPLEVGMPADIVVQVIKLGPAHAATAIPQIQRNKPYIHNGGILYIEHDPELVLVHGQDKHCSGRLRKALIDNKFEKAIVVYNTAGKIPDQNKFDSTLKKIRDTLGEITEIDISTLDIPPSMARGTKSTRKKGAFFDTDVYMNTQFSAKVNTSKLKPEQKVYCKVQLSHRHGHLRYWNIDIDGENYSNSSWDVLSEHLQKLRKYTAIPLPVFVTPRMLAATRMAKNPEWTEFGVYLKTKLTDPAEIAALAKRVNKYVPKIQLKDNTYEPLPVLVNMKEYFPNVYAAIEPRLKHHNIWKDIERTHNVTKNPQSTENVPELIAAYRATIRYLMGSAAQNVVLPDISKADSAVNKKLGEQFERLDYHLLHKVAQISPQACITMLNEALI